MRSSNKSRSRNKSSGRSRNVGNVVNRVFESSGPEGKVRGTPQQIIEKYQGLAHDAQLSNDRVAAENYQQHAEHYTRLLDDAQREQAERQAAEDRKRQQQNPQEQGSDDAADERGAQPREQHQSRDRDQNQNRDQNRDRQPDTGDRGPQPDVLGHDDAGDAELLVDTPESNANGGGDNGGGGKPRSRNRRAGPKNAASSGQGSDGKQAAEPPVQ